MIHKKLTLYKNSVMRNLQDVLHFKTPHHQKRYWDSQESIIIDKEVNFRSERGVINVSLPYKEVKTVNYCSFYDEEYMQEMYAFVINVSYVNKETTRLDIVPDYVSTFCQGRVVNESLRGSVTYPIRQHYGLETYKERIIELKHSDDFPVITNKAHLNKRSKVFKYFYVLVGSAVDLTKDFGNVDKPKQSASKGGTYDELIGVLDLYLVGHHNYKEFMSWLSPYPWIQQNILFNILIPTAFIDSKDTEPVKLHKQPSELDNAVRTFKNKTRSSEYPLLDLIISYNQQLSQLSLQPGRDDHLLRSELVEYRLTDFVNNLLIAPEKLRHGQDLKLKAVTTIGYHNDIKIVAESYASHISGDWRVGESVNYSLQLTPFDELPTSLDNGKLQLSGSAYQRELERSNTLEGRLKRVTNESGSMKDRIMAGLSLYSSVIAGGGALGKIGGLYQDQYEYERAKLADKKQLGISQPSISMGTNANSPFVSNGIYGVYLETISASQNEIRKARDYFNLYGHKADYSGRVISNVWSMSICNWVQFRGSWLINGVGQNEMQVIRDLFEGGVRLWHVTDDMKHGLYGGLDLADNRPLSNEEMEKW